MQFKSVLLIAIAMIRLATPVSAATLNSDTVLGPDHPYPNETISVVDGANPPTHVTILDGTIIGGIPGQSAQPIGIDAFGLSEVTMLGGFVMGERAALLHDRSVFQMVGGDIGVIEARDDSRVIVKGGDWGVRAFDSSRVHINSPRDNDDNFVRTFGESRTVIEGLDEFSLVTADSSTAVVRGGEFHFIHATGNSRILVDGGYFSDSSPGAYENGVIDIWSIEAIAEEEIVAAGNGIVNIYGTDLHFDERDDHGTLIQFIAGKLADGDNFAARYWIRDQGQIILHEVPEPGALAMLAVGAGALLAARRRRMGSLAGAAG